MMKRWMMALALLVCLCLLAACQNGETTKFQVNTPSSGTQNSGSNGNSGNVLVGDEYMNPLAEEDGGYDDTSWLEELPTPEAPTPTPALVFRGEYAGATPVPIDPIDKPTPTKVPALPAFNYKTYEATKLGLSFDAPVGWTPTTPETGYYVLTNPSKAVNYQAQIVVHAEKVSSKYNENDLKSVVKGMLDDIDADGAVVEFSPTNTASRTLLEATGVYADYTATLSNGAEIRGRVQATCVEKVLYTVHVSAPKAYWSEYKDGVYDKLRETIRITK